MSFDNPTNRGRAANIAKLLDHVEKSAKSNRAKPEEISDVLAPVFESLAELQATPKTNDTTPSPNSRYHLSEVIAKFTLSECSSAIALCMIRIDEALAEAELF